MTTTRQTAYMQPEISTLPVEKPTKEAQIAGFDRWFRVVPADTPSLTEEAYRLRYQVYCLENPFEDPAENPGGLETDRYDRHAVHSLLIHRPTGTISGAVRLILPEADNLSDCLPIQRICAPELFQAVGPFDMSRCAEISRFAVSKKYRRRIGESRFADNAWGEQSQVDQGRRQLPYITLGLFRASLRMCIEQQITHLFAVMEPALIRLIKRFGLEFTPMGPLVDYHGRRQPCFGAIKDMLVASQAHNKDCWDVGTDNGRLRLD